MASLKEARNRLKTTRKRLSFALRSVMGRTRLAMRGERPKVIVMVDGGLCSAITKYVIGECFKKHLGLEVKYDLSWFETEGMDCDGKHARRFTLTTLFPDVDMIEATAEELRFYKRYFHYTNPQPYAYNAGLFKSRAPLYLDGYAENWRYFAEVEETVLPALAFDQLPLDAANLDVLSDIESAQTSVAVHVRRGDYVKLGMASLGTDYYLAAIDKIAAITGERDIRVFFFSDDIDWVRSAIASNLPEGVAARCVDVNDVQSGHLDLYLISRCDHQVSSNSSFGYWGGLLNRNPDKIVLLPDRWLPGHERSPEQAGCDNAHSYPGFIKMENQPTGGTAETGRIRSQH